MSVGIVGLGLIGGSFARAIRAYTEHRVYGLDRPEVLAQAGDVLSGQLTDDRLGQVDVLIVALYPRAAMEFLREKAPLIGKNTLVFDTGGIKSGICQVGFSLAEQYGFRFLGGHPMAGLEQSGWAWSRADLFQGASMIFVPGGDETALTLGGDFVRRLGFGRVTVTTAQQHDRIIACTSQLAHVVSSAYIKSPTAQDFAGFSAGSFRDMTRVAYLNADMWTELFLDNRGPLLAELHHIIGALQDYAAALDDGDAPRLHALLEAGAERKRQSEAQYQKG